MITPIYQKVIKTEYKINSKKILQKVFDEDGITACNLFSRTNSNKRFFGAIPRVFIEKVPQTDKRTAVMHLRKALAEFAKAVSECNSQIEQKFSELSDNKLLALKRNVSMELASKLIEYLKKLLRQPIKMDVVGEGSFGRVFKMDIGGKKFALKTFFKQEEFQTGHGGDIEPLIAQFLKKATNSGIVAKCFFGRIAPFSGKGAYMVSKFIEKTDRPKIRNYGLLTAANPIKWGDASFEPLQAFDINHINGIIYDLGGAELKPYFPNDKETAKIIRILCQLIDSSDEEGFKTYLQKNIKNPKFQKAKKYLRKDLRTNKVFATQLCNKNFTKQQKSMMRKLGLKETPSVKAISEKQDREYIKTLMACIFP